MLTLEELIALLNANEKRDVAKGMQEAFLGAPLANGSPSGLHQFCKFATSSKATAGDKSAPTLLESYISSSPQCAELFRVWDALAAEDRHSSLASSLVSAFALILEHNVAPQTRGTSHPSPCAHDGSGQYAGNALRPARLHAVPLQHAFIGRARRDNRSTAPAHRHGWHQSLCGASRLQGRSLAMRSTDRAR